MQFPGTERTTGAEFSDRRRRSDLESEFELKCRSLEDSLHRPKPKVELPKAHRRLLRLAKQRSAKNGAVQRNDRRPAAFDNLVSLGLLTADGKYVELG